MTISIFLTCARLESYSARLAEIVQTPFYFTMAQWFRNVIIPRARRGGFVQRAGVDPRGSISIVLNEVVKENRYLVLNARGTI